MSACPLDNIFVGIVVKIGKKTMVNWLVDFSFQHLNNVLTKDKDNEQESQQSYKGSSRNKLVKLILIDIVSAYKILQLIISKQNFHLVSKKKL